MVMYINIIIIYNYIYIYIYGQTCRPLESLAGRPRWTPSPPRALTWIRREDFVFRHQNTQITRALTSKAMVISDDLKHFNRRFSPNFTVVMVISPNLII